MSSPSHAAGPREFTFTRNLSLLNQTASLGLRVSGDLQPDVLSAIQSESDAFPARDIELAEIGLEASTGAPIEFGRGSDKVSFTARAGVFAGLGVYRNGDSLLRKLGERAEDFSLDALEFDVDDQSLLGVLRWGFSAEGKANGALALRAVGTATLSMSGNKEGLFAVIRRLPVTMGARAVIQEIADSWMLPRQITSIDQVAPGTWLIAEVTGGFSVKLGAQLGYDFNWVREAKSGGLTGDIGLRLQMGINAAVGFSASGRCAVVVSRDSDEKQLRLQFFRLKTRQFDLSMDASLGIEAIDTLLPGKIDDFISAVFDTHGQQILKDLKVVEKWTRPETKLSDLLAGAGIGGAEKLIAHLSGVTPDKLQEEFDAVHDHAVSFIRKWHELPHTASATILKLVEEKADLTEVRKVSNLLGTISGEQLRTLLDTQLSRIDFFHTPVGRLLESTADNHVLELLSLPIHEVQGIGKRISALLDGSTSEETLQKFQAFVATQLHLNNILNVVTDTDFARLDPLLKRKLANFLGQDNIVVKDLENVRKSVNVLLEKREEYYEKALEALHRKYNFALNSAYQSTTSDEALLDATFDFSHDSASVSTFFQQAVQGQFDILLANQPSQVKLAAGKISHGVKRQTHVDVTLPFLDSSQSHLNDSLASVEAVPNSGGLLFKLKSSDTVTASNQRKSTLSLVTSLSQSNPSAAGVRLHQDSLEMNYTMLFARRNMKLKHVRAQIGPAAKTFFKTKLPNIPAFLEFLDRQSEDVLPNGPNVLGNGLISLQVSLSNAAASNAGHAWLNLPKERTADVYVDLSNAIQLSLKRNIHDCVFSSPEAYTNAIASAQTVIAYCAVVPRAQKASGKTDFPYWDFVDRKERRIMLDKPQTLNRMKDLLARAGEVLAGDSDAQFFRPEDAASILSSISADDSVLNSLFFSEAEVIKHAFEGGLQIAAMQNDTPSSAVKALETFGAKLTEAFNSNITSLLGPGLQALGTRVFLDASRSLDPARAAVMEETSAMLNLEFLKSDGKFDADKLLADGRVPAADLAFADRIVEL
jgi:hypothetical protein